MTACLYARRLRVRVEPRRIPRWLLIPDDVRELSDASDPLVEVRTGGRVLSATGRRREAGAEPHAEAEPLAMAG